MMHTSDGGMDMLFWWITLAVLVVALVGLTGTVFVLLRRPAGSHVGTKIRGSVVRKLSQKFRIAAGPPSSDTDDSTEFAFLVMPDISGYTRFLNKSRFAVAHAQYAIGQLLEAMIEATRDDLTPAKLEGDAILFFAVPRLRESREHLGQRVRDAVLRMISAFYQRQRQLMGASSCGCSACTHVASLNLKTIVHAGEIYRVRVMGTTELGGIPVVAVHRLLKHRVDEESYILITAEAAPWIKFDELASPRTTIGILEGIGEIEIALYSMDHVRPVHYMPRPVSRLRGMWAKFRGAVAAALDR